MNTRNVFCFTISQIYSCLHLLLQEDFLRISDSFIQPSLPPWNKHTEDLVAKTKQKISHKPPGPGKSVLELHKDSCHVVATRFLKTSDPASTFQKPLSWYFPVFFFFFFRKSNGQRAFSSKQYVLSLNKSGGKNSHSFILDWKTPPLNFWGKKNQFWKSQFPCPHPHCLILFY